MLRPNPAADSRLFQPAVYLGLDLGKERDHTVLALLERRWQLGEWSHALHAHPRRPVLVLRDLVRVPLNTPYTEVPRLVRDGLVRYEAAQPWPVSLKTGISLVVDAGGVGGGVLDILRNQREQKYLSPLELVPVFTSGGLEPNHTAKGTHTVPRRDLLTALKALVEARSLLIPHRLALAEDWCGELLTLRAHGRSQRRHDDLAMATSLGVWWAVQQNKALLDPPGSAFLGRALQLAA